MLVGANMLAGKLRCAKCAPVHDALSIRKKYTMQISHKYKSSLLAILEG
jgi:hypothetical protein